MSALLVAAPIHTPQLEAKNPPRIRSARSLEADANLHFKQGNDKFERERLPGAIAEYDKAVEIVVPYLADAYYNRSTIKATLQDRDGAIEI